MWFHDLVAAAVVHRFPVAVQGVLVGAATAEAVAAIVCPQVGLRYHWGFRNWAGEHTEEAKGFLALPRTMGQAGN